MSNNSFFLRLSRPGFDELMRWCFMLFGVIEFTRIMSNRCFNMVVFPDKDDEHKKIFNIGMGGWDPRILPRSRVIQGVFVVSLLARYRIQSLTFITNWVGTALQLK